MPLHLLGKKSWNVYNPAAIERVRRDEAEAQRQAEEREKKALRDEADERVRLLRGDAPQPSDDSAKTIQVQVHDNDNATALRVPPPHRIQKRRLAGEDDTDRDIRIARERQVATTLSLKRQGPDEKEEDDSIVDSNGNISLIPVRHQHQQQLHNDSSGSAARKKAKIDEDPYTVYLSHAAGKDKDLATSKPWYYGGSSTGNDGLLTRAKWGDDSDRRRERESARIASQDPLATMKRGVRQLREAEKQRQKWMEQRERDLREVEDLAVAAGARKRKGTIDDESHGDKHHHHHHRRRRKRRDDDADVDGDRDAEETSRQRRRRSKHADDNSRDTTSRMRDADEDSLDGFNLDQGYINTNTNTGRSDRDRDRDRGRDRSREHGPYDRHRDDKSRHVDDNHRRHPHNGRHDRHDSHRHGHRHRSQRDDSPHHHHRHPRRSPDERDV
ncbi:hypothetical protein ABEF95_016343 [Exophiala dermatitidis]